MPSMPALALTCAFSASASARFIAGPTRTRVRGPDSVLTLSVNNIFDEKYYASTGFYNTVNYGEGVGAELMLRARF